MSINKKIDSTNASQQLEQAIEDFREILLNEIVSVRANAQKLIDLVGLNKLGRDVKIEIDALISLFDEPNKRSKEESKSRTRIKTTAKKSLVIEHLKKNKGQLSKPELLKIAAQHFDVDPAASFLDAALDDKKMFRKEPKGSHLIITLLESGTPPKE